MFTFVNSNVEHVLLLGPSALNVAVLWGIWSVEKLYGVESHAKAFGRHKQRVLKYAGAVTGYGESSKAAESSP